MWPGPHVGLVDALGQAELAARDDAVGVHRKHPRGGVAGSAVKAWMPSSKGMACGLGPALLCEGAGVVLAEDVHDEQGVG